MKLMTYRAATALVVFLFGAAAYSNGATVPSTFIMNLPEGYTGFSQQVQSTKSPEGDIRTTTWISKAPTGEAIVVTMSEMPGKILDPQKLITSTRASLLRTLGATLETEEARSGELPSARLQFRSDAAFFRARFTVVDDRLYQLLYVGRSTEQRTAPSVGQMFESFRILDDVETASNPPS
ncbi:MAG TPA: hypothetical protein VF608_02455 [Thermoanaerobaculia bacterium]